MDEHETLGIAPDATADEITSAYRRLARELHPDLHPGSSPEQRAHYESSMARVNRAYHQISTRGEPWRPRARREPGPGECRMCGHAPAASVSFDYQRGILFSRHRLSFRSSLCRDCARAVGRSYQDRTLRRGWWGPTLFVTNVGVVARNARALRAARRLTDPAPVPDVRASLAKPMPPGNPVALRAGPWIVALGVALVVCLWLGLRPGDAPATSSRESFAPGVCVLAGNAVTTVPCAEPHDARIVALAARPGDCSPATDAYVRAGPRVLCLRLSS